MSAIVMYSAGRASVLQETVSFWDVNSSPIFFWKSMLYQISPNPEAGLLALEYSSSRLTSWHPGTPDDTACQCKRRKRHGLHPWVRRIPSRRNGNPLQHSCLENSMDRGVWWASVYGVAELGTTDEAAEHTWWSCIQRGMWVCVCVHALVYQKKNSDPQPMMLAQKWPHSGTCLEVQWLRLYFHCRGCGFNPWLEN